MNEGYSMPGAGTPKGFRNRGREVSSRRSSFLMQQNESASLVFEVNGSYFLPKDGNEGAAAADATQKNAAMERGLTSTAEEKMTSTPRRGSIVNSSQGVVRRNSLSMEDFVNHLPGMLSRRSSVSEISVANPSSAPSAATIHPGAMNRRGSLSMEELAAQIPGLSARRGSSPEVIAEQASKSHDAQIRPAETVGQETAEQAPSLPSFSRNEGDSLPKKVVLIDAENKERQLAAGFVKVSSAERSKQRFSIRQSIQRRVSTGGQVQNLLHEQAELVELKRREKEEESKTDNDFFDRALFYGSSAGFAGPGANKKADAEIPTFEAPSYSQGFTSFAEKQAQVNRLVASHNRIRRLSSVTEPINYYDVVEAGIQAASASSNQSDPLAGKIIESPHFQNLILLLIIANTVLSIMYSIPYFEVNAGRHIDQFDNILLTIFVAEMVLKMRYLRKSFWLDNWNVFDFMLITLSLLGTLLRESGVGGGGSALRVIRACRTLRILGAVRKLQIVVKTFIKSLAELTSIVGMIFILLFMFAVLGVQLFGAAVPEYFGTLTVAFKSLFICITQDGWVAIWGAVDAQRDRIGIGILAQFYFISFIVIGAWIFINVTSGITVTNWQLYVSEMKELELARFHSIEKHSLRGTNEPVEARPVSNSNVDPEKWAGQTPLASASNLGRTSVQKLENYMLVIAAMDKNLREYGELKAKLVNHIGIIGKTNEAEADEFAALQAMKTDRKQSFFSGDVLSAIQMAGDAKVANTRRGSLTYRIMT